ncbi:restriction endonuclease subunit S [Mycoplasma sp. E35C]|uniref:restriction endonuclease subunit S n=1 Tax=Mycoplasma sp. E35C TaxID=2801918 RepID=UPI001CA425DA|nr:restriction endonuclease subunit S [Mycoplasma sp. E35C]QZX49320.1 restriction endonuclease subunit S [Mycoplasma sp. E35C]
MNNKQKQSYQLTNEITNKYLLGEICDIFQGKMLAKQKDSNGKYKFFIDSKKEHYINSYMYDGEYLIINTNQYAGDIKYYDGKFNISADLRALKVNHDQVLTKYLFYFLKLHFKKYVLSIIKKRKSPYLTNNEIKSFSVVVPSLTKQKKIVGILDDFSDYLDGLKKEMQLRKQQLEYYLDQMLNVDLDLE